MGRYSPRVEFDHSVIITSEEMVETFQVEDEERWKRLLFVATTTTDGLYDSDQGIHQHILRALGFQGEYISYSSSRSGGRKRLKSQGHNWASAARVFRAVRRSSSVKLLHWTYTAFKNQLRQALPPNHHPNPHLTHARGIFMDKQRMILLVYEPREYRGEICPWFGSSLNDFVRRFKAYRRLLVYGNQRKTHHCEKRTLRFGLCCWHRFLSSGNEQRDCPCGLEITHITTLYIRK